MQGDNVKRCEVGFLKLLNLFYFRVRVHKVTELGYDDLYITLENLTLWPSPSTFYSMHSRGSYIRRPEGGEPRGLGRFPPGKKIVRRLSFCSTAQMKAQTKANHGHECISTAVGEPVNNQEA
jgi:hypothetical protein